MKEYGILDDNDDALFTATISALDINKFNNEVLVKIKVAKEILSTMDLKENGCMHPEKFHNKMIEYVDLSEEAGTGTGGGGAAAAAAALLVAFDVESTAELFVAVPADD